MLPIEARSAVPDAIAAIDIGTNSIHMVIARLATNGRFEVVTRQKEMVRLGSGAAKMKELEPDAIERGISALKRCSTLADSFGAPARAVATSALREARNANEFLIRARREAGLKVDVISGSEEARLIYLGVLQALPVYEQHTVLVDVGGGSTEVLFGHGGEVDYARSIKLGSLRVTNKFFPDGEVVDKAVSKCRKYVRSKVVLLGHETAKYDRSVTVVSSGTAEALAVMALIRRDGEPPVKMNAATFTCTEVTSLIDELAAAPDAASRRDLPGLDPSRADIILAGAIVLEQVCLALGLDELTVSEFALREGVLLDSQQRLGITPGDELRNLRRRSVFHLMELCDDDPDHSVQVARLALSLHDELAEHMRLPPEAREILEAAALLANVGMFIAHSSHHKHSYYVIRNSEHLMGFTNREIELIAQVARYHRKSAPSDRHPEFAMLDESDQDLVRALAALLRISIGMDRNHDGRVASLRIKAKGDPVVIRLIPRDSRDLDLEVFSASERSRSLAGCLGKEVRVRAGQNPDN